MVDGLNVICRECRNKYYENNKKSIIAKSKQYEKTEKGKQAKKRYGDKKKNTFGKTGHKRGYGGILKRDYELTKEQLERRNTQRKLQGAQIQKQKGGILIWYDGWLDNLSTKEYIRIQNNEYHRQKRCAISGHIGRVKPSEHFLFDFDLEQMLKDNVYYANGGHKLYITKWWKGTIRHWTVNDGIWKNG